MNKYVFIMKNIFEIYFIKRITVILILVNV